MTSLAAIPWVAFATAGGVLLYLVTLSIYWARKRRKQRKEDGS